MLTSLIILSCANCSLPQPCVGEKPQQIVFVVKKENELLSTRGKEVVLTYAPSKKNPLGLRDLEAQPLDENDIAIMLKRDTVRKEPILIGVILLVPKETSVDHLNGLMDLYVRNNNSLVPVHVTFYIKASTKK
jgi:hypothetical protein